MFNEIFNHIKNLDEVLGKIDDEDMVTTIHWILNTSVLFRITEGELPLMTGNVCEGTKAAFCYAEDWDDDDNNFGTLHVVYASMSDDGEYYEPKTKKLRKWFEQDMETIVNKTVKTMEEHAATHGYEFRGAKWQVVCDYASIKLIKDEDGEPCAFEVRVHRNALHYDNDYVEE